MVKNILKGFTIAVTGDFGPARPYETMKRWIQLNGANFATQVDQQTTHLVCSKAHFKMNVANVRDARAIKTVKIVSYDWLEDCLMKARRLGVREYLMSSKTSTEAKIKKKIRRTKVIKKGIEAFKKGCKDFEAEMVTSTGYHIYTDWTGYLYDITLVRSDLLANSNERHILKLYESNAIPRHFACYERYNVPGREACGQILAPVGSSWDKAYDQFKNFFKLKTHLDWDMRLMKTQVPGDAFRFKRPADGEPKGVLMGEELDGSSLAETVA